MNHNFPMYVLALWFALATGLTPALRAQALEGPPPAPAAAPAPTAPALPDETSADGEQQPTREGTVAAEPPAKPEDGNTVESGAAEAEKSGETPRGEVPAVSGEEPPLRDLTEPESRPARPKSSRQRTHRRSDAPPLGDHAVTRGSRQSEAISLLGDTTVDGHVTNQAVSVLGSTTVNGRVDGEAVSVLGTTTVNGSVGQQAVAVIGDVVLGPGAVIEGDAISVLGRVVRGAGSEVHGDVVQVSFGHLGDFAWLEAYIDKCVRWGRPLWFGENLGWAWAVAAGFLVLYMLLALLFPRGIVRCAEALEQRPGSTILAALLTALLTPLLTILLVMTGVGIVLLPFIGAGLFLAMLFGKAAVLAWFGRRVTPRLGDGPMTHAAVAVFFGGLIVCALYLIPFLGFLLQKFFGMLGLGMVVYVLLTASRREKPAAVAAAAPAAPAPVVAPVVYAIPAVPAGPAHSGVAGTIEGVPPPAAPLVPPVVISAATLPRVGFWLRLAAGLLDFLLIGIAVALVDEILWFDFDGPGVLFLALAAYSAAMWKARGTTIGGIICGLKVVRVDDRPIDWTIAIVRALAGFLSFALAGLGFIWVAFDDEKQSWHDKVAGTTIVKVPKGVSLL